jgi:hypothetical protein
MNVRRTMSTDERCCLARKYAMHHMLASVQREETVTLLCRCMYCASYTTAQRNRSQDVKCNQKTGSRSSHLIQREQRAPTDCTATFGANAVKEAAMPMSPLQPEPRMNLCCWMLSDARMGLVRSSPATQSCLLLVTEYRRTLRLYMCGLASLVSTGVSAGTTGHSSGSATRDTFKA